MRRLGKWPRTLLIYLSLLAVTLFLAVDRSPIRERDAVPAMASPAAGSDSPPVPAERPASPETGRDAASPDRPGSPVGGVPLDNSLFHVLLRMGLPLLDAYPVHADPLATWRQISLADLLTRLAADFRASQFRMLLQTSVPVLALSEPEHGGASPADARQGASEWPLPGGVPAPTPRGAGEPAVGPLRPLEPDAAPRVIIYSTHAHEAFLPTLADRGVGGESPYTDDPNLSIIRVAGELARVLREEHGVPVVHLPDVFDAGGLTGAYMESEKGVQAAMARYPAARVLLDVHRDSSDRTATVTVINGQTVARVMFVVGMGNTHLPNPHWRDNQAFARTIARALDAAYPPDPAGGGRRYPPLVRQLGDGDGDPLTYGRNGRFNQHLSPTAALIEIGGPNNTLEEELRTARMVARAVAEVVGAGERP